MEPVYRGLTAAQLDAQYDVEAAVPELPRLMAGYAASSARVRGSAAAGTDLAYGDDPLQTLDLFAPTDAAAAPIHVYIHGGYWRGGSRLGRAFPAEIFNARGAVWVPVDYRLVPAVGLDDVVADVRRAIAWVYRNAVEWGGDRDRIHVSGTSAGGHLAAMLMLDGWQADFDLPGDVVKGGCAMSGLFDLEPLRHTRENATLRLDRGLIARNSPIRRVPRQARPLLLAWGERESQAFKRQSRDFAAAWRARGHAAEEIELAGHDHFSAIAELANPDGVLLGAIFAQMGLTSRRSSPAAAHSIRPGR